MSAEVSAEALNEHQWLCCVSDCSDQAPEISRQFVMRVGSKQQAKLFGRICPGRGISLLSSD